MKIHIFSFVLWVCCLVSLAHSACDLKGKKQDVAFPDITKDVAESYIMGVEYSISGAKQTDYYTEYYDTLFKRGRLECHISKKSQTYIYQYETWESWTIQDKNCTLKNITVVPDFEKELMTDWRRRPAGSERPDIIGPSAMFKIALDAWATKTDSEMAYMGEFPGSVRGEKAVYWRRCLRSGGYGDYIFAASSVQNPFDTGKVLTPLRVVFDNISTEQGLKKEEYDIISFQHYIPKGVEPFQLPKGKNCDRGQLVDGPVLPDFSDNSLFLSAEVIYQKYNKDGEDMATYYSTLTFALDKESSHIAYYYAPWNVTKFQKKTRNDTLMDSPQYIIYDMKHMYAYRINFDTAKCEVSRDKSFVPQYKLPEDGGYFYLTDPYILFPYKNLKFLSEGKNRGLDVNIFEAEIKNFLLDKSTEIPRVIASHSFLKSNEELENTVSVKYAPTQIQLRLFRNDAEEVLTLNVFGFTTRIPQRRRLFDVTRCFKNDDDSLVLTIGYEIENQYLQQVEKALPSIEENTVGFVTMKSELNAVRIPYVMTDFKDTYVYVTMVILGKPPLQIDYNAEKGKKIKTSSTDDAQGVSTFEICANNCLEERTNCWGFSMCGASCYYGSDKVTQVETDDKCILYRRVDNDTYMPSKEKLTNELVMLVKDLQFIITAPIGDNMVTLTATSADIFDPAEDDAVFEKMGNRLNPRMRVLKVAKKLKKGSNIKNLGKLRYDECQSLCLDFKNCETLSYCLKNSECILGNKYDTDLTDGDMESNDMCILLARKYTDNFDRTPGVFVESVAGTKKDINKVEDCARACLKEGGFKCLSFDHCSDGKGKACSLYTTHYLSPEDRKASVKGKDPRCGHYTRKYSTEFKKKAETRVVGSKVPPIMNLTLEQCAKSCIEYGEGACFGYDFCQDKSLYATSCTLFDTDPSRMKTAYNSICTNYVRTESEYAPHPYTNSYAGGIGFLCFLVGALIGAVVVFAIAYIRANRG